MEIEKNGNIDAEINASFKKINSNFRVKEWDGEIKNPLTYARVEYQNKFSQVYLGAHEKNYLPDFWRDGVCLAHGKTSSVMYPSNQAHLSSASSSG